MVKKFTLNKRYIHGTVALLLFIAIWHVTAITGMFGRFPSQYSMLLLPTPLSVFEAIREMIASGYLLKHVFISFTRVMTGFGLAVLIGLPLGILMAFSNVANNYLEPIVRIFQPIPGIAWVPIAILWFGLGDQAAIFIITIGSLFPVLLNTLAGVRNVDRSWLEAAMLLGANRWQLITRVVFPSLVPYLVTAFRISLGFAWRALIAAEMVGVPNGLGYMLGIGRATGKTEVTIVTMVVLGLIMLTLDELLFASMERKVSNWKKGVAGIG